MAVVGDSDIEVTFAAVGRALTRWERVEMGLASLYAKFDGSILWFEAARQYGQRNTSFSVRLSAVQRMAEAFFIRNCCQDSEGRFAAICTEALRLSEVRNNIAHGMVELVQYWTAPDFSLVEKDEDLGPKLHILIPPLYTRDRLKILANQGMGASEILAASEPFITLASEVEALLQHYTKSPPRRS